MSGMDEVIAWKICDEDEVVASGLYRLIEDGGMGHFLKAVREREVGEDWRLIWSVLVYIQESRNYSPYWLVYRLDEIKPPLEVWQQLALRLNYKMGWAYHCFQESQAEPEPKKKRLQVKGKKG